MNFTTAWSTNAVSVCHACGLGKITRIERSRRYRLDLAKDAALTKDQETAFLALVHDRMTECPYPAPLKTFETGIKPEPVRIIPLMEQGRAALEKINREMGLGLDDWDLDYYTNLFVKDIKRNPTNVECFDLSQSNSEHSRHWFFRGKLIVDGKEIPGNLMKIVKATYDANPNNSVIAFSDNSSAITGYDITTIIPEIVGKPSAVPCRRSESTISSLPPRRTTSRRAWRPSPAPRPARAAASATCRRPARAASWSRARRPTAWATSAFRATSFPGKTQHIHIRIISPRRSGSRSRPATARRTTATSSASP